MVEGRVHTRFCVPPLLEHDWDVKFFENELPNSVPVAGVCIAAYELFGFPILPTPAEHPSRKLLLDQVSMPFGSRDPLAICERCCDPRP